MHPRHDNGNVLSDRWELVDDSSTPVKILLSVCGDGGSTKFKTCISNKCILANSFLQPTDKIISSVTHRTYPFTHYEKSYVICN